MPYRDVTYMRLSPGAKLVPDMSTWAQWGTTGNLSLNAKTAACGACGWGQWATR